MDLSSGSLILSYIEVLRSVEYLEKRERGFMSSKGQIQNTQVILSKHAERMMTCECEVMEEGEYVTFNVKQVVKALFFHACYMMLEEIDH